MNQSRIFLITLLLTVISCKESSQSLPLRAANDTSTPFPAACPFSADDSPTAANRMIAHAGGVIDDNIYTESLEAYNSSFASGFKLFEMDFMSTSDDELVGIHDWEPWRTKYQKQMLGESIPSRAQFLNMPYIDGLTNMDFTAIWAWIKQHDAILVTDKTEDLKYLAGHADDKNRLYVEIFHFEKFVEALQLGIKYPMLSFESNRSDVSEQQFLEFVDSWHVTIIPLPVEDITAPANANLMAQLKARGVCLLAFTVDDVDELEEISNLGIIGFYTDYMSPD